MPIPTVTLDYPSDGGTVGVPFIATGHTTPPGAAAVLYDDTTGAVLGGIQSDASGAYAIPVSSLTANGFAAIGIGKAIGSVIVQSAAGAANISATGIGGSIASAVEKVGAAIQAAGASSSIGQSAFVGLQASVSAAGVGGSAFDSASVKAGPTLAATGMGASLLDSSNPTMTSGTSFTDTFSDSSLDTTKWATETAGTGSVVETTSLAISSVGADPNAAALILKQNFAFGTVLTFSIDFYPNSAGGDHIVLANIAESATQPGVGSSSVTDLLTRFTLLYGATDNQYHFYYRDTTGTGQEIGTGAAEPNVSLLRRAVFEMTATQARMSILNQADLTVIATSGWINLSAVQNGGNPLWLRIGEFFTNIWQGSVVLRRFERA